jgi:hypothetical protein
LLIGVNVDAVRRVVRVPPDFTVESVCAVGEPNEFLVILLQFVLATLDPIEMHTDWRRIPHRDVVSV